MADTPGEIDSGALATLEARVAELEHDLVALAELVGRIFGEPFRSHAFEIVLKRQIVGR